MSIDRTIPQSQQTSLEKDIQQNRNLDETRGSGTQDMDVDDEPASMDVDGPPLRILRSRGSGGNAGKRKEPPITESASESPKRFKLKKVDVPLPSPQVLQGSSIDKPIDVDELFVSIPIPISMSFPLIPNPGMATVYP